LYFFGSEQTLNVLAQDGVDVMVDFIKETFKTTSSPERNSMDLMLRNISRIAFRSKRTSNLKKQNLEF
jgi:ethanolamine utilization microcompartment shell protein EutL